MKENINQKKSVGAYVYASMFCDKNLKPTSKVVMTFLLMKHFLSYEKKFDCPYKAVHNNTGISENTVGKCLTELEENGYISTEEGGNSVKVVKVNVEKMQTESLGYKLVGCKERENDTPTTAVDTTDENPTQSDAAVEANPTQSDIAKKEKMVDVNLNLNPISISSKEKPQRTMTDTSIQRETYQEAKRAEYSFEGYSESMKKRLIYLFSQMDKSIERVTQRRNEELASKTNSLADRVFQDTTNAIVNDIDDFLIQYGDNAKHLEDRILSRMNNRMKITDSLNNVRCLSMMN